MCVYLYCLLLYLIYIYFYSSTPVETLHTILLGPYKYLLHSLMGHVSSAQKEEIQTRIESFNFSGFDTKLSYNLCSHFRSWVNAHDGRERTWVEVDQTTGGTKGGVRKPTGKGTCLIILHAGSCKGWINGAELVIQSKNIIKMKRQMNILKSGLMIP